MKRTWKTLIAVGAGLVLADCKRASDEHEPAWAATASNSALAPALAMAAASSVIQRALPTAPLDVAAPPAGAIQHGLGVASRVLQRGSGTRKPADDDRVTLDYVTFRRDGTFIDGSGPAGQPSVQSVRSLFPGLRKVVTTMTRGESRRVWIPASLTFMRDEEDRAHNVNLTVDVTLLDVKPAPARPAQLSSTPPSAKRTATGLAWERLKKGSGERHPMPNDRVTLQHSMWTLDGALFESSVMAGQPLSVVVRDLPAGLREGVQLLSVGDKARFWIPERLGYARGRGAPKGPVVCDVELLAID